jgi:hypothetical protein
LKPAHPFLTSELDVQRARQRRALRLIPDSVIQRTATESLGGPVGHVDDPMIEEKLRELADDDIEALREDLDARAGLWTGLCGDRMAPSLRPDEMA